MIHNTGITGGGGGKVITLSVYFGGGRTPEALNVAYTDDGKTLKQIGVYAYQTEIIQVLAGTPVNICGEISTYTTSGEEAQLEPTLYVSNLVGMFFNDSSVRVN